MDQIKWQRYIMQTATKMEDLNGIIKDTGIEQIDRDHRRLVEYILEMGEAVRYAETQEYDSARLATQTLLFNRFLTALSSHFKTEERFMDRYLLGGKEEQVKEHGKILSHFHTILSDFENGILSTFQTMRINLISELIDHINGIDHQTFLLENFLPTLKKAQEWKDVEEVIKTTGLPFVDSEHRDLTNLIIAFKHTLLRIDYVIRTKTQKEEVLRMLKQLFKSAQSHFTNEETFLKKYNLDPGKQGQAHFEFLGKVHKLARKVEKNHSLDFENFINYLLEWWINHINGIDYVEFHFSRIATPVFNMAKTDEDFSQLIRKTGIDSVDAEHTHLIGLLLKLNDNNGTGEKTDINAELERITGFAAAHFKHEEMIMEEQDLNGRDIHKDAHEKLLKYVGEAMRHALSGRSRVSSSLLRRIMRWWIYHTNGMDFDTFVLNRRLT